jgi:hypothetical protein
MSNKFKALPFKQKIGYIWDYYRFRIIVSIIIIGVLTSYISNLINRPDIDVYCLVLNDANNETLKEHINSTYPKFIKNTKKSASVDLGFTLAFDEQKNMYWTDNVSSIKFLEITSSGQNDVVITDYNCMIWAISNDFVLPITDIIPEEYYEQLEPYFVSIKHEDIRYNVKEFIPYGLDISKSKHYKKYTDKYKDGILCYCSASKNPEAVVRFIKYMFDLK